MSHDVSDARDMAIWLRTAQAQIEANCATNASLSVTRQEGVPPRQIVYCVRIRELSRNS